MSKKMIEVKTKNCHKRKHPEILIRVEPKTVLDSDIEWLVSTLEESVQSGTKYEHGEKLQIGWMITEFRSHDSGLLCLHEPDMKSLPLQFIPSVTTTLRHLRLHKDVVGSFEPALEVDFPMLSQSAIICTRLKGSEYCIMSRVEPDGDDSGWFVGCTDDEHDHDDPRELTRVSLYELVLKYHAPVLAFLALPPEASLTTEEGTLRAFYRERKIRTRKGSFLEGCYKAKR
jgi:hypothetical protein